MSSPETPIAVPVDIRNTQSTCTLTVSRPMLAAALNCCTGLKVTQSSVKNSVSGRFELGG